MSQEFPGYYRVLGDYDGLEIIKKDTVPLLWGARTKKECQRLITVLNYLDYYSDKFIKNFPHDRDIDEFVESELKDSEREKERRMKRCLSDL